MHVEDALIRGRTYHSIRQHQFHDIAITEFRAVHEQMNKASTNALISRPIDHVTNPTASGVQGECRLADNDE